MKKLLSLLSVLTISGTAVPTTVAANPYQKEENFNNLQTNNLKNLNRVKRYYENRRYDDLSKDLNSELNDNQINLGIIQNDSEDCIFEKIKEIYPNLDISQIKITDKKNYSYFSKGFSAKIKVKNNSTKYVPNVLNKKLIFNTNINIQNIAQIISNDQKVKQWIEHIKDWNNDVKNEIKNVNEKTPNEKSEWKNRKKEDLKNYVRDWSYVLNLIEHEQKLNELNNSIQGIKEEIENLKLKINELDKNIKLINNSSNKILENCSNYGFLVSSASSIIPIIGTIISAVSGVAAYVCSIVNS